jgi:hypothetical protein
MMKSILLILVILVLSGCATTKSVAENPAGITLQNDKSSDTIDAATVNQSQINWFGVRLRKA